MRFLGSRPCWNGVAYGGSVDAVNRTDSLPCLRITGNTEFKGSIQPDSIIPTTGISESNMPSPISSVVEVNVESGGDLVVAWR